MRRALVNCFGDRRGVLGRIGVRRTRAASRRRERVGMQADSLLVDRLESRLALAAIPTATVGGAAGALIGQEVPLTVTFDNTATNPSDKIGRAHV